MVIVKTNPGSSPPWTGAVHKEGSFLQRKVFLPRLGDLLERCCQALKGFLLGEVISYTKVKERTLPKLKEHEVSAISVVPDEEVSCLS